MSASIEGKSDETNNLSKPLNAFKVKSDHEGTTEEISLYKAIEKFLESECKFIHKSGKRNRFKFRIRQLLVAALHHAYQYTQNFENFISETAVSLSDGMNNHERIQTLMKELTILKENNVALVKKNQNTELELVKLSAEIEKLAQQNQQYKEMVEKLQAKVSKTERMDVHMQNTEMESVAEKETEFQSLPNFGREHLEFNTSNLQKMIKEKEAEIKKLNEMNFQWQYFNKNRNEEIKKLKETIAALKEKISQLNAQIKGYTNFSDNTTLNPVQQKIVDAFYKEIKEEADMFRSQRDATVKDAQHNITAAKRLQEAAEKKLKSFQKRVEQLESQVASLLSQLEEHKTALIVATRTRITQPISDQHNSQDKQQLEFFKEQSRKFEAEYKKSLKDYQRVLNQNTKLIQRLHQSLSQNSMESDNSTRRTISQDVVRGPPGYQQRSNTTLPNQDDFDDIVPDSIS